MASIAAVRGGIEASADFDGDGKLDHVSIVNNRLRIEIASRQAFLSVSATDIRTADVDCDGRLDLVLEPGRRILFNAQIISAVDNGGIAAIGDFQPVWNSSSTTLENATRHIIADLDGDGRMELYTSDYNGPTGADVATIRMFENNADNSWTEVWSYSDGPRIFNGFAVADTDGDGKLELVAGKIGGSYLGGSYVGPRVYIFESDADNHLVLDHLIEVDPAVSSFTLMDDLAVGDANGDGQLDIAVGLADNETLQNSTWGSRIRAYTWNAGTNQYAMIANHTQTNTGIGYCTAIDIGDSDHDGQPEIIFFERIIVNIYRLEFNGASFAIKSNPSGISAGVCSDVMCVDCDGDGVTDLLCGGSSGAFGHVYVFKSSANDAYLPAFTDSANIGNTVLYVNVDNSVSPPIIAGSAHSDDVLVMRYNSGAATYDTIDFFHVPAATQLHEITIGHLDQDCGLDVMLTHFNGAFSSGVYEQREIAPHQGDINCSGGVNVDDLLAVINTWGPCPVPPTACPTDIAPPGGDGQVNVDDLLVVINHWG